MSLSCGDEFSIAVDDSGITWVWGLDDLGQLGMEFNRSVKQTGKKVCIFAPNPNPQIPTIQCHTVYDKPMVEYITLFYYFISNTQSPDNSDESLLQIDLDWNLPDFANIGNSITHFMTNSIYIRYNLWTSSFI